MARSVRILLEGRPGSGKTTVVRKLVELLRTHAVSLVGFTTEEIRNEGRRVGFSVETMDGERALLAHVDLPGPPRVGRYGVDLAAFERLALPALDHTGAVVIVDELGKMELASHRFRASVLRLFDERAPVIATVHASRHPFTDALKARHEVEVLRVTDANRDQLPYTLVDRLAER